MVKSILGSVCLLLLVMVCYQDSVRGYGWGSGYGGYWAWSYGYWWQDPYGYYYEPPLRQYYYDYIGDEYIPHKEIKKHHPCDAPCALRRH